MYLKNIGGIYEVPKSVEQTGNVYSPTPKDIQKEAIAFLNKQLFETPTWLLNRDILNKFSNPVTAETVGIFKQMLSIALFLTLVLAGWFTVAIALEQPIHTIPMTCFPMRKVVYGVN